MTQAYPLTWPDNMPRWSRGRQDSQFRTELPTALNNVTKALRAFGAESGKPVSKIVISSNVTLGADSPTDPGVAVWFTWEDQQICIAVDRYATVKANLQAIYHVLEARRTELRHGTLALVRATMKGFVALPAPKDWRAVLGYPPNAEPNAERISTHYRAVARDIGPSNTQALTELNLARDRALKEIGQ